MACPWWWSHSCPCPIPFWAILKSSGWDLQCLIMEGKIFLRPMTTIYSWKCSLERLKLTSVQWLLFGILLYHKSVGLKPTSTRRNSRRCLEGRNHLGLLVFPCRCTCAIFPSRRKKWVMWVTQQRISRTAPVMACLQRFFLCASNAFDAPPCRAKSKFHKTSTFWSQNLFFSFHSFPFLFAASQSWAHWPPMARKSAAFASLELRALEPRAKKL